MDDRRDFILAGISCLAGALLIYIGVDLVTGGMLTDALCARALSDDTDTDHGPDDDGTD